MLKYGAKSVYKHGIGSDDQDNIIEYFNTWKKDMWPSLCRAFGAVAVEGITPLTVDIGGAMEEEAPPGLKDVKRELPFNCIMTSFKTEKKLTELNKENTNYDFRLKNFLACDTYRVLNVTELRDHPTEDSFTCLMELLLPKT
jgi:hypothetical protein